MRSRAAAALVVLALLATPLLAQGNGFGVVPFANSGAPAAQEAFLDGFALLHNFEYAYAADAFRKAQEIDPSFVMAYWGEAMTYNHPIWFQQDREAALKVLARLGATPAERAAKAKTERERDYLHAVEVLYGDGSKEDRDDLYSEAMAQLHAKYPDDVDATAFYALSILGTAHEGRDFAKYMRSAALLEEVFPKNEHHPGVLHYLIHSYDDPIHAPLGLRAARLYGKVAPNAGHALHMTSHIFVALGMWDDVIDANERAVKVVNAQRAERGLAPRGCGHYVTWLHYGYLQEKKLDEAKKWIDGCRQTALAEAPKPTQPTDPDDTDVTSWAEMRLFDLVDGGRWDRADTDAMLKKTTYATARMLTFYGEALAAIGRGDMKTARLAADKLREEKPRVLAAVKESKDSNPTYAAKAEILPMQIDGLLQIADDETGSGLALLQQAAAKEGALPEAFGPPVIEKPGYELLGEQLLAAGKNAEAARAFQTALSRAPGRTASMAGLAKAKAATSNATPVEKKIPEPAHAH